MATDCLVALGGRHGQMCAQTLYHYTDIAGFISIIAKTKCLWATHIKYMNDLSEAAYGAQMCLDAINAKTQSEPAFSPSRALYKAATLRIEQIDGVNPFVCCFCENGDLLSQWRGYGANGAGIAIGFDGSKLADEFSLTGMSNLSKIEYDVSAQAIEIDEIINVYNANFQKSYSAQSHDTCVADIELVFSATLAAAALTMKSNQFAEEREWRITNHTGTQIDFRAARGNLVPFCELKPKSGKLPITKIIVGPSANENMIIKSAEMLLKTNGYSHVLVEKSAVPYRGA